MCFAVSYTIMIGWPRTLHAIRRCYIYFYYTSSPSPLFFAFISICKRLMNWLTIFCDDVYTRTQTSKSYRYICILKEYWKFCSWLRNKSLTYIQIETERARERERRRNKTARYALISCRWHLLLSLLKYIMV